MAEGSRGMNGIVAFALCVGVLSLFILWAWGTARWDDPESWPHRVPPTATPGYTPWPTPTPYTGDLIEDFKDPNITGLGDTVSKPFGMNVSFCFTEDSINQGKNAIRDASKHLEDTLPPLSVYEVPDCSVADVHITAGTQVCPTWVGDCRGESEGRIGGIAEIGGSRIWTKPNVGSAFTVSVHELLHSIIGMDHVSEHIRPSIMRSQTAGRGGLTESDIFYLKVWASECAVHGKLWTEVVARCDSPDSQAPDAVQSAEARRDSLVAEVALAQAAYDTADALRAQRFNEYNTARDAHSRATDAVVAEWTVLATTENEGLLGGNDIADNAQYSITTFKRWLLAGGVGGSDVFIAQAPQGAIVDVIEAIHDVGGTQLTEALVDNTQPAWNELRSAGANIQPTYDHWAFISYYESVISSLNPGNDDASAVIRSLEDRRLTRLALESAITARRAATSEWETAAARLDSTQQQLAANQAGTSPQ